MSTPLQRLFIFALLVLLAGSTFAADIFVRLKVLEPAGDKFSVATRVRTHVANWGFAGPKVEVAGGAWSEWIDLSKNPLHERLARSGGNAEWPFLQLTLTQPGVKQLLGCSVAVQLADKPDEGSAVISFTEKSASNTIGFLLPNPLREKKDEFETGAQMATRHLAWAKEAAGTDPIALKQFDVITSCNSYDNGLLDQEMEALKRLGFTVVGNAYYTPLDSLKKFGFRTFANSMFYGGDAEKWKPGNLQPAWDAYMKESYRAKMFGGPDTDWFQKNTAFWAISDEIVTRGYTKQFPRDVLNGWFRDYLRMKGVTAEELGKPIDQVAYPEDSILIPELPRDGDFYARRLQYYMAKFGQWKSANFLREITGCYHQTPFPSMTLPTDHGFFGFWGPGTYGMSYKLLDFFELGAQQSVDILASEDWLGLNFMYGPDVTLTGAQTFEYYTALMGCGIEGQPMKLMTFITPSEGPYLKLKAYSTLGQGTKNFYFWDFGPTYMATENYWADVKSEYDGIANFTRALQKAEPIAFPAQPVRDQVAILYSVSSDIWNNNDQAAFVENRLTWHALRHLGIQPRFLREEDVEAGKLTGYKVCVLNGWCLTRKAAAALDQWVKDGGVLYLTAGAAVRDEAFEPYLAPFASAVWPTDAAKQLTSMGLPMYNERTNLTTLKPMARVNVTLDGAAFSLPVLGARLNLKDNPAVKPCATFDDGTPAGALAPYGKGKILALGFMPMLAYGQGANFQPKTLSEHWPAAPRKLISLALEAGKVQPVAKASEPVVETSLLTGPAGSALVLANYTYAPVKQLTVDVKVAHQVARAVSTEGKPVKMTKIPGGVRLTLPLDWTDIVLLPRR